MSKFSITLQPTNQRKENCEKKYKITNPITSYVNHNPRSC
jgi:hypothetical protein